MTILKNKEYQITKDLPHSEKELGVDLKLDTSSDLEVNNLSDIALVAGINNVSQATFVKLSTETRGNRYHPAIGVEYPIGEKTVGAVNLRFDILRSLRQDPRYGKVDVKVEVNGNVYLITINLSVLISM